jgi:hypothetical protein
MKKMLNNLLDAFTARLINEDHVTCPKVPTRHALARLLVLHSKCGDVLIREERGDPSASISELNPNVCGVVGRIPLSRCPVLGLNLDPVLVPTFHLYFLFVRLNPASQSASNPI